MSRFRQITAFHIARMIFALAGGVLFALIVFANSAQAGCGDYLFVRNASGHLVPASSLMKVHNDNPQGTQAPVSGDETFPVKVPCQGPNCSIRSQLPVVPVPPTASQRSVQDALLLNLNSSDGDAGSRFGFVAWTDDHELHYPQSIFHPPR